jgi:hypothetical protein
VSDFYEAKNLPDSEIYWKLLPPLFRLGTDDPQGEWGKIAERYLVKWLYIMMSHVPVSYFSSHTHQHLISTDENAAGRYQGAEDMKFGARQ